MKEINIIKNVTCIDTERFIHDDKDVIKLASMSSNDAKEVKLYKPNLKNGKVNVCTINVCLAHANGVELAKEVASYFYTLVDADVSAVANKVGDIHPEDLTDEDKIKRDVLLKRIANAHAIVEAGKPVNVVPGKIAKILAMVRYGVKAEMYGAEVIAAVNPIMGELKNLYAIDSNDGSLPNVLNLRGLVTTFGRAIWTGDNTGNVDNYTFNCNHSLARDVYSVYKSRRRFDKKGNVESKTADAGVVVNEVILAIVEQLQKKYKEA